MPIEDAVRRRAEELIEEAHHLSVGNKYEQIEDQEHGEECSAWITAAQNVVHLICTSADSPYRQRTDQIASALRGYTVHQSVGELAAILSRLLKDADAGLLSSVADQARAETFDNFLDHADDYLRAGQKNESGVIAGAVFEDTIRRVCRRLEIEEKDQKIDGLISVLAARGEFSPVKAKRARAAADVRTKASHARWDEFELDDVKATVEFTREMIAAKLDH